MKDAIERVWRRVMLMTGRGRVTVVDDSGPVQMLQVQLGADEVKDKTPRLAQYGLTSSPPVGSDCMVVFLGGERSNGVAIATGHQASRLKGLKAGEVALYDDLGQEVRISRSGITIRGAGLPVTITGAPLITLDAPAVHCTGTLTVDGDIASGGSVIAAGNVSDMGGARGSLADSRDVFNGHTHGTDGSPPNQQE